MAKASPETALPSVGAGLENLGNTCFLNAVLQCFTHMAPLVQSLRSFHHVSPCFCEGKGFCVLCALREQVELSLASPGQVVSPHKLVENLNYLSSSFQRFQQEDAHEFLQCMLNGLHNCCVDSRSQDKPLSLPENSFVEQIFGGRLRSKLRCCNCGHCTDSFEPLIDLSLEIEGAETLCSALKSFTKVEKIGDSETKIACGNCKEEATVEKQLTIDRAPAVATLHLKRFKSDGLFVEKIKDFVKYPLELDLQPFLSDSNASNNTESKYDLYAVLVHSGISSDSGHYFCFIRSSPNTWHRLDDSKVVEVSEECGLHQEAYILFYSRKGSPWFSSLMGTLKRNVFTSIASTSPFSVLDDYMSLNAASTSPNSVLDDPIATVPFDSSSGSEVEEGTDAPSTPPRKSSADIIRKKPSLVQSAERSYEIPRTHLEKDVERGWKKPANHVFGDGRADQSLSRLLRSMPSSRSSQMSRYIAHPRGCHSEGSLAGSKRQRLLQPGGMPRSQEKAESSSPRRRWNMPRNLMHSLAAGDPNAVFEFNSV